VGPLHPNVTDSFYRTRPLYWLHCLYAIELALQRVEKKSSIPLSRQIGIPNIASKGKLTPCTVRIPKRYGLHSDGKNHSRKKLVEELSSTEANNISQPNLSHEVPKRSEIEERIDASLGIASSTAESPSWTWAKGIQGDRILIRFRVPKLVCGILGSFFLNILTTLQHEFRPTLSSHLRLSIWNHVVSFSTFPMSISWTSTSTSSNLMLRHLLMVCQNRCRCSNECVN
jgi:hypothetical protein